MLGNVGLPADHVYTSEEWTNADLPRCPPFEASKTYAEKAAWDFVKDLEDEKKFELVTILPALVFGPLIFPKFNLSHGVYIKCCFSFLCDSILFSSFLI
eukprot:m.231319 g.231319  ORF g.231319 m.231319 type:complete len:99 (+) comp40067_c4_seq2:253-549(+)